MSNDKRTTDILESLKADSGEWIDVPGQACLRLFKEVGPTAVKPVAELLAEAADNSVKLHCVVLLTAVGWPEAGDALASALDLPLADEVREQIFEDALASRDLRGHKRFVQKARALYRMWPKPELRDFLDAADQP
jgi:hypothetical protein